MPPAWPARCRTCTTAGRPNATSRERQRLGHILDGTNVGTREPNIDTGEMHVNERWAHIGGRAPEALGAMTVPAWTDDMHDDDRARSREPLARHYAGELEHYELEARIRHRDGRWVRVLDRGKVCARHGDGSLRWMAGTRMDISQRKSDEQALRDSEAFLDRAGRIAGVGGWDRRLGARRGHLIGPELPHPRGPAGLATGLVRGACLLPARRVPNEELYRSNELMVAAKAAAQRPGDLVARSGGKEFAGLLPGTDLDGALAVAAGVERLVRTLGIKHAASDVVDVATVSVGAAAGVLADRRRWSRSPTCGSTVPSARAAAKSAAPR